MSRDRTAGSIGRMSRREIRVLGPSDLDALLRFLTTHAETTMFLRSNLLKAGIEDHGEIFQGTYVGVLEEGRLVGAAVHNWNGDVHVQCPVALGDTVRFAVEASGRGVFGFLGPWEQVQEAREALGPDGRTPELESRERLFSLELARLRVPTALQCGDVAVRLARPAEIEAPLTDWRLDFERESLGAEATESRRARGRLMLEASLEREALFVLEGPNGPLAMSLFNAAVPDCVQIGSVFTPPSLRCRGYARAVVAGSLLFARSRGVTRSLLFTEEDNTAAQTAYRALGYTEAGHFALVLYAK